ncbi:Cell wall protein IFF11 [Candida viswanathii]|uniref:Cell wall protein IFF11 n=1 Tax=Candida viswanathii TaxID=5486 RepID=A0A367YP27_9ASCO|nr:Cell wall protein IFF11 [Candida viswanathii]
MLLKNLIVPLLATTATVTATFDLTASLTKYSSFDFGCGDISISKGASFSLIDKFDAAFQGDITIEKDCKFFLASKVEALKVSVAGLFNKIVNKGIWCITSLEAAKQATCNIIGASFENTGQCIFAVKAEIVKIISLKWKNSGCLHFYQEFKTSCIAEIGAWLGFLTNEGTICLTNYKCKNSASIIGAGCIAIEKDSCFYIANSLLQIDTKHTFFLGEGNPTIQASPNVFPQTFNVANFGGSHKIGLDCPLQASGGWFGQKAFSYDSKKGILTLRASGLASQNFKIGTGYDEKKFSIVSDDSVGAVSVKNGAIQYNGPCPNPGRPSICQACPPPPSVPGTEPTTTTTTVVSTKTDGAICTEIDEVRISTDATGSWFTTTSTSLNCGAPSQASSIPNTQVTVTSTYTGVTTLTTTASGTSTDTVIVQVPSTPNSQVTTTTTATDVTEATATTITGTSTDTVIVVIPATTETTSTLTNTWTGTVTTTVTTSDLVIVQVPSSDISSALSTLTAGSSADSSSEDEGGYSTSYTTVTAKTTEIVTVTSCSNNGCHQTTAPTGVTVITVTESDMSTVITTYCPLTQTHTLGVSSSSTVDLGCPTGWFGFDGLPGKNIHFDFSASKSIGFYIDINKFHKRDEGNSSSSSSSSAAAGAMNTVYGVEFLSAVALVLAFIF